MADIFSKDKRSWIMSQIKSKGTKLEIEFINALEARGIDKFCVHPSEIFGHPDIVFYEYKIAIFVDSCFWHGCKKHLRIPQKNKFYWINKIQKNINRDKEVNAKLKHEGWVVFRIWEHSIKNKKSRNWWLTRINNFIHI